MNVCMCACMCVCASRSLHVQHFLALLDVAYCSHFGLAGVSHRFCWGVASRMATLQESTDLQLPELEPCHQEVVYKLRDDLSASDSLKCQVLELRDFIVWPSKRKDINVRLLSANVNLLQLCAPSVKAWRAITQIDVMHWILMSVLGNYKARVCYVFFLLRLHLL